MTAEHTPVKIMKLHPDAKYPHRGSVLAAGYDVFAQTVTPITLNPGDRVLVPTGIAVQLQEGFECQVRPRSGLALKKGLTVLNTPGTVDADYTGEIGVILVNLSSAPAIIQPQERIAQLVFTRHAVADFIEVEGFNATARGESGFGSTGTTES